MIWPFRRRDRLVFDRGAGIAALTDWPSMADDVRERVLGHAEVLAGRLRWEAAKGMDLDSTIISTVAARAGLLVAGRSPDELRVRTVVVHQQTVVVDGERAGPGGTRSRGQRRLHGQADDRGLVLLDWGAVRRGGRDGRHRYDVVIHEFAHTLDAGDGMFDGTPAIGEALRGRWVELATDRYDALRRGDDTGVLRTYGATSTAEFFAVAVETLFERPHALAAADPDFHEVLVEVVGIDPGAWRPRPPEVG